MKDKLKKILDNSYSPYSKVKVAAIVITKNGEEFKGVNVENAAYPSSICAERSAIFNAISNGVNPNEIKELHLLGSTKKMLYPCGACRQVMTEFFNEEVKISVYDISGNHNDLRISELLPNGVRMKDLD